VIEEELDTPCTRLGFEGRELCTGCRSRLADGGQARCYRAGRSVARTRRHREALAAMRSESTTVWDVYRRTRPALMTDIFEALAQVYGGPKWTGSYAMESEAKGLKVYEVRRYWVLGTPVRKWGEICESLGMKKGPSVLERQWNRLTYLPQAFGAAP
jgi:hypothetical protein